MKFSGLILGPKLPKESTRIGKFIIKPIELDEAKELYNKYLKIKASLSSPGVDYTPPIKSVFSFHLFQIDVEADSVEEGLKIAEKELGTLNVFLTIIAEGRRYHSKILDGPTEIEIIDGIKYISYPLLKSETGIFGYFDVDSVNADFFEEFDDYYKLNDKTLNRCLEYFIKAWSFRDAIGKAQTLEPALQNYFLIIENISERISSNWMKKNKSNVSEIKIALINDFVNKKYTDGELLKEYNKLIIQVQKAELTNIRNKINHACKVLNIEENIREEAVDFIEVRNSLSHPRTKNSIEKKWLNIESPGQPILAEKIPRIFLKSYMKFIISS